MKKSKKTLKNFKKLFTSVNLCDIISMIKKGR